MKSKGLTHIYYGNGKGKTTAALGLAIRAAGCGKNVIIVQFLKDWKCGELNALEKIPNITVLNIKNIGGGFVKDMSAQSKLDLTKKHDEKLIEALELQKEGKCDLLILDEVLDAYQLGVLDSILFENLLKSKPEAMELVITGHMADEKLLKDAHYVTQMLKHKHPYDEGVEARRGIEF